MAVSVDFDQTGWISIVIRVFARRTFLVLSFSNSLFVSSEKTSDAFSNAWT